MPSQVTLDKASSRENPELGSGFVNGHRERNVLVAMQQEIDTVVPEEASHLLMIGQVIERMVNERDAKPIEGICTVAYMGLYLFLRYQGSPLVVIATAEPRRVEPNDVNRNINVVEGPLAKGLAISEALGAAWPQLAATK